MCVCYLIMRIWYVFPPHAVLPCLYSIYRNGLLLFSFYNKRQQFDYFQFWFICSPFKLQYQYIHTMMMLLHVKNHTDDSSEEICGQLEILEKQELFSFYLGRMYASSILASILDDVGISPLLVVCVSTCSGWPS